MKTEKDEIIFHSQLDLWLKQSNGALGVVNVGVMAFTVYVAWGIQTPLITLSWLVFGIITFLLRLYLFRWLPNHPETFRFTDITQSRSAVFSTFIAGAHWGCAGLLFLSNQDMEVFLFVMCTIAALSAGALPSMSTYLPTFIGYIVPSSTLTSLALFMLDKFALSFLSLVFMGIFINLARNMNNTSRDLISLDFKNAALVKEVTIAKEEAEAANFAKSQFLAAASHDLRQPLHAMGMLLHALENRAEDAETLEILTKVIQSHQTLDELFNALLEITRLDSGAVSPIKSHIYLSSLIDPLISEFSIKAQNKGLGLEVGYDEKAVITDRVLCSRILRNIISNAINYTQDGSINVQVERLEDMIEVKVSDTGIGIDATELDNIFNEYYQLGNIERSRHKGFGLGLAVVRRMTDLLQHSLSVESVPGQGSTFSVTLPIGDPTQVIAEQKEPIAHPLSQLRVLVIDDDHSTLDAMKLILTEWQCTILLAESFDMAMAEIDQQQFEFDLIITDYRLTYGVTGLTVIKTLRAKFGQHLPALIISGDTDPKLLRSIREQGFFLLHKPLKPTHLNKVMRQLTEQVQAIAEL